MWIKVDSRVLFEDETFSNLAIKKSGITTFFEIIQFCRQIFENFHKVNIDYHTTIYAQTHTQNTYTHTIPHIHTIYIYIYMCVCVCVCVQNSQMSKM